MDTVRSIHCRYVVFLCFFPCTRRCFAPRQGGDYLGTDKTDIKKDQLAGQWKRKQYGVLYYFLKTKQGVVLPYVNCFLRVPPINYDDLWDEWISDIPYLRDKK
jgi:hypothetical protein